MTFETEFVTLSEQERLDLLRYVFRKRLTFWKAFALIASMVAILAFAFSFHLMGVMAIALVLAGVLDMLLVEKWLKSQLRDPKNASISLPSRGIYTPEALTIERKDGMLWTLPWSSIVDSEPYGEDHLVYIARNQPIVLLRRLYSDEEWKQIMEWIPSPASGREAPD